jgi:hypothetical protein
VASEFQGVPQEVADGVAVLNDEDSCHGRR